jgi:hypothetical protein
MARLLALLMLVMIALPGCQTWPGQKSNQPVAEMDAAAPKDATTTPAKSADSKPSYETPVVQEPGLALATDQRFKDIPLPVGLKEDLDRTFVYESASLQVGRMVYSSRASLVELAQFFLKECPVAGWKLQNVLEAENSKTMVFGRAGKRVEILVQALGVSRGRRVSITLTPEGQGGGM